MLIIVGEAEAASGRRDRMLEAAAAMAAATQSDDGCDMYGFYVDVSRPDVILSLELWRDQAALDAHMDHRHTQEFLATVPSLVVGTPEMRFFEGEPAAQDQA